MRDAALAAQLKASLVQQATLRPMPGISSPQALDCLTEQLVDSVRRVRYVRLIARRPIDPRRSDPSSSLFDPIKGAVEVHRQGLVDEACWLIFLSTHFGHTLQNRWELVRRVYGRLGGAKWSWRAVTQNLPGFRNWAASNGAQVKAGGVRFSNHRKYEPISRLPDVVESYVKWVAAAGSHQKLFSDAVAAANGDPLRAFDVLYKSMKAVQSFGRTGRFDYLTMIGKVGFAQIAPPAAYLSGSTGPWNGACLLYGAAARRAGRKCVEGWLVQLGGALQVDMQVIEDALCNWQKSPTRYVYFAG